MLMPLVKSFSVVRLTVVFVLLGFAFSVSCVPQTMAQPASSQAAPNTLESWTRFGLRTSGDSLIYDEPDPERSGTSPDGAALRRALLALQLESNSQLTKSIVNVHNFSRVLLTKAEYISLFGPKTDAASLAALSQDPFRRREVIKAFNEKFLPRLLAETPKFPVKLRFLVRTKIWTYNFDTATFPIEVRRIVGPSTSEKSPVLFDRVAGLHGTKITTDLMGFPSSLPMTEEAAQSFFEKFKHVDPKTLYSTLTIATDFEMTGAYGGADRPEIDEGWTGIHTPLGFLPKLEARVLAVSVYEDPSLSRLVARLSIDRYRR